MRVIGTAGHVDHGKSTLVEALSGTHPDRLKEEREREMTIDLGFAWITLPGGEDVGIVDVPGHRDFIENMLAGVGGIDAALFVIAADEGVMPQTREHLAILDLLQITSGVVALTKIDLIDDLEWVDLVEDDVRATLEGTVLESAPIVRVSGRTGEGLPELIAALGSCLADHPPRADFGRPRLPVDRVFTIAGFGTVVTGTLSDGRFQVGDELVVLPEGIKGRVRGLQTHKRKEEVAVPGSRTAVNISGVTVDQIKRGDVIAHPGTYQPTGRLDVRFRLLKDASSPIKHNTEVKLFIGAAEVVARLRLLGVEELKPGQEGWLQLELKQPVVAVRNDRYILRRPSPGETLGGGAVVDPHPRRRHKRFSGEILRRLEALAQGTPADVIMEALAASGAVRLKDVISRTNLDEVTAQEALHKLFQAGQIVDWEDKLATAQRIPSDTLVSDQGYWQNLVARAVDECETYHKNYPLRRGMSREELKSRLGVDNRVYNALLKKLVLSGELSEAGPLVYHPAHQIVFTAEQQGAIDKLMARFMESPYAPPTIKECIAAIGDDVFTALVDLERLIQVSGDVVFSREGYNQMVAEIKRLLAEKGAITAAEVRDHFKTSRRYVLSLLEHLDALGVTVRVGDVRRLKN